MNVKHLPQHRGRNPEVLIDGTRYLVECQRYTEGLFFVVHRFDARGGRYAFVGNKMPGRPYIGNAQETQMVIDVMRATGRYDD